VRFPVKLLVFFVLLVAVLAGWGVDALREYEPKAMQRRLRVLVPCGCTLAAAILVWVAGWLAPGLITAPAAWAFVQARSLFPDPSHPLTSQEIAAASTYFLEMLRLHLPGLAGFSLAAIAWLVAVDRGKTWARRALPAVVGAGILQMLLTNYSVNPTVSKSFYTYRPPVLDQVERGSGPYRFAYIQRDPFYPPETSAVGSFINLDSIPEAEGFSMLAQSGFSSRLTLSHGSMLAKVDAVQNIDLDKSLPTSFVEFWVFLLRRSQDLAHHDCLLGRSNVKYLIRAPLPSVAVNEVGTVFNGSAQPSVLYETRCYTPRTYLAGNALYSSSSFETLSQLSDPSFDPEETVYINLNSEASGHPRARDMDAQRPRQAGKVTAGRVWIVDYQADAVTLGAELTRPGYVVLLDRYDPNWHATLDNQEVPILRANHIFRALKAETGTHVVRFYYRQRGLRAGATLSACSMVLLAVLWKLDPGRSKATSE
jgi:Bacterial membrane protein YfhO